MGAREAFLDPRRIPGEDVDVPEMSAHVYVASIGAKLRGDLISSVAAKESEADITGWVMAHMTDILIDSLRDPETRLRLFAEADAALLADLDPAVALRLTLIAIRKSGMTAQAKEEAAKNSESIQSESSISS